PISWEIRILKLEKPLHSMGAILHYPRMRDRKNIEFVRVEEGFSGPWEVTSNGIEEPPRRFPPVDPNELDWIFVPGVAFSVQGNRIGLGRGYFDSFLSQNRRALRLALAYEFQLIERISAHSWDQKVDWILTENR